MNRNRIFLIAVSIAVTASCAGAANDQGLLRRLWQDYPLPAAPTESQAVDQFVAQNRTDLGLGLRQEIEARRISITPCAIGQRYLYNQYAFGLPVFGADMVLTAQGRVMHSLCNDFSTADFQRQSARLSSNQALQAARNAVNAGALTVPPQVELGYTTEGRLVYIVRLSVANPPAAWELWLDAASGKIMKQADRRQFAVGVGRVFIPDPKTALECDTLHDWNDANWAIPPAAYDTVVLRGLDPPVGGFYYLTGSYVSTAPTANRAHAARPIFAYWRQDDRFEEVMTYYHIDREQRYYQNQLMTPNANNTQQQVNVNGTTEDNSWFNPLDRVITYGTGGVDDAEDADVILHEYGHAVQNDILGILWGWFGQTGAMGEGYGDYQAGSYSLVIDSTFHPNWVYTWDGHNEFWPGRMLNMPYHYPEDLTGEIYHDGMMWSAGLMDVWWDISSKVAWDRIVLQHHFLLNINVTMADAANAILTVENNLYQGQYHDVILQNFIARGFINPDDAVASAFTAGSQGQALAASPAMLQPASPNPFNPTTAISYQLQTTSRVSLKVFDTAGRLVSTLVDGWREAGIHQVTFDGSGLASGLYFVRMQAGDYSGVQKMMLVK